MDTHLVNSQFLSRKDVRVWFFESGKEYAGECRAVADNGIMFHIKTERPKGADPLNWMSSVCQTLMGKSLNVELSSPKVRGEVRIKIVQASIASTKNESLSMMGRFLAPPDPSFMKVLLEPVVRKVEKK